MKQIKRIALIIIAIAAINFGCTNNPGKEEKSGTGNDKNVVTKSGSTDTDSKTIHLTSQSFKEKVFNYEVNKEWKYEGDKPCIIDFYADWCGPCKQIAPILEELANEYDGKITVYKIDTDKQKELAGAFGIRSIPSLLFVPATGQPQMSQGALPKEQFVKIIDEFLLKAEIES